MNQPTQIDIGKEIINMKNEIAELQKMHGSMDKYFRDVYVFINKYLDQFPEELKKLKEVLYDITEQNDENAMEMVHDI